MNFGFTDDQQFLRSEVRKVLDGSYPLATVRKLVEGESSGGSDRILWNQISTLGWPGLCVPEAFGGAGLDLESLIVVLEETGRTLLPSPLISTILAAKAIEQFGDLTQRERWLPSLADGSKIGAFAVLEESDSLEFEKFTSMGRIDGDVLVLSGEKRFVPDAVGADWFVVALRIGECPEGRSVTGNGGGEPAGHALPGKGESIALVVVERDRPGVAVRSTAGMDLTKPMGTLGLAEVRVPLGNVLGSMPGRAAAEWLVDLGAALVTAESIGAMEAALDLTTRFARDRIQFGNPIGHYQGVKHPLAETYVDLESFRSLAYYAIWALDHDAPDAQLAVSRAKAYASEAFAQAGILGVQLHGGVGYTWEYDIQLYLKRSKWFRPIFGDADFHYERAARLGGL